MHELRITDRELQHLLGDALRKKLRLAGFKTGMSEGNSCSFCLPVRLDLVGEVTLHRDDEAGVWTLRQEAEPLLRERTAETAGFHLEAVMRTANAVERE